MFRTSVALGVCALALVLLASGGSWGQDTKAKGSLPTYWSRLSLTEEQKTRTLTIRAEYRTKIDALKQQIAQLEKQERGELEKVLTSDQKEALRKLIASKVPGGDAPTKEKDK